MLQELLEIVKQNALIWFNNLGVLIAWVLGILTLLEFKKKRVSLSIKLEQDEFTSRQIDVNNKIIDATNIEINVDLKNTGLEPTTLAGVDFVSDKELLTNLSAYTNREPMLAQLPSGECITISVGGEKFNNMRIEPKDRKIFKIFIFKKVFLPNDILELNAKLIFRTTEREISNKIKLIRVHGKSL